MVADSTSRIWPAAVPLPAGTRLFDREEAERLNRSRAFMLRLEVLAKLPMTEAWIPDFGSCWREIANVCLCDYQT